MSYEEQQKKEIETIQERTVKLELSDADCDRLVDLCGRYGLTVGKLFENFVGDLVDGTYSNGSDERNCANQWFKHCWFGMSPEPTLLNHLLSLDYDPEKYLNVCDSIASAEEERKYAIGHLEKYGEEKIAGIDDDIAEWEDIKNEMKADWKPNEETDMAKELEIIKQWVEEKEKFIGQKEV